MLINKEIIVTTSAYIAETRKMSLPAEIKENASNFALIYLDKNNIIDSFIISIENHTGDL